MTSLRTLFSVAKTLLFKTHRKRWQSVAAAGVPPWDSRNQLIASFIPAGSSVIDLGSGAQTLRKHLPPGCEYQPCDLVRSSPDVIVCDFNAGHYPEPGRRFTHVVCSGVLEYIRDHRRFISGVSALGDQVILSYNLRVPAVSRIQRMTNNWVNHFSRDELETMFSDAGLSYESLHTSEGGEAIYRLATGK